VAISGVSSEKGHHFQLTERHRAYVAVWNETDPDPVPQGHR
jgi:hypothetical protein